MPEKMLRQLSTSTTSLLRVGSGWETAIVTVETEQVHNHIDLRYLEGVVVNILARNAPRRLVVLVVHRDLDDKQNTSFNQSPHEAQQQFLCVPCRYAQRVPHLHRALSQTREAKQSAGKGTEDSTSKHCRCTHCHATPLVCKGLCRSSPHGQRALSLSFQTRP